MEKKWYNGEEMKPKATEESERKADVHRQFDGEAVGVCAVALGE